MQAVTRVKLEQFSKGVMWTPTHPGNGEGFQQYLPSAARTPGTHKK
jgi:hypothetical protein